MCAAVDQEGLDELAAEIGAPIETDVVDLLDARGDERLGDDARVAPRRPRRRARPPRRRLAWRHADRRCAARGLGLPERAPRANRPARDAGVRVSTSSRAATAASYSSRRARRRRRRIPNAVYAAAKAASETWTLALADRFKGAGATANIVVVGAIVTPQMRAESPDKDFSTFTPAEEIAEAIAYLCSDAAVVDERSARDAARRRLTRLPLRAELQRDERGEACEHEPQIRTRCAEHETQRRAPTSCVESPRFASAVTVNASYPPRPSKRRKANARSARSSRREDGRVDRRRARARLARPSRAVPPSARRAPAGTAPSR